MKVTKRSPRTGQENTRKIGCTEEQYASWQQGTPIQVAMPNVPAEDREFLMSGYTPEDWKAIFGDEE